MFNHSSNDINNGTNTVRNSFNVLTGIVKTLVGNSPALPALLMTFGTGLFIAFFLVIITVILPTSLLGKNVNEIKDMGTLIQEDLNDAYIQATGLTSNTLMENIESTFNCSTKNNYYRQFWEVNENALNSSYLTYDKQEGTNVWLFQKATYGEEGKNACYVLIKYTPSLSEMNSSSSDSDVTLKDIIYSYALSVNNVLEIYPPSGTVGKLGTIHPSIMSSSAYKLAKKGSKTNWSGYTNYATMLYSWTSMKSMNYANSKQINDYEQFYSRPGYSDQETGLTLQVTMTGVETQVEGTRYGSGRCGDVHSYKSASSESDSELLAESGCFADETYKQIVKLGVENGFILRYPMNKEEYTGHLGQYWTFRYVGKEVAEWCYNDGQWRTLEEYLLSTGAIDSSDYGDFEVTDRTTLTSTTLDDYVEGSAGGKDVTSEMGTDLDLVNNKRYVSKDYVPDDLMLCDDSVALRKGACEAYLNWQEAVANYESDTSSESTENSEDNEALENFSGNALDTETGGISSEAQDVLSHYSSSTTDATSEETRNYIKKWASTYFVTDANYPSHWVVTKRKGIATIDAISDTYSCPDGYTLIYSTTGEYDSNGNLKQKCRLDSDYSVMMDAIANNDTYMYTDAQRGTATINVYYDLTKYRATDIENAISNMVGQGRCDFTSDDSSNTCTEAEAKKVFWQAVADTYNNTIGLYTDDCVTDKDDENYGLCDPSEDYIFYNSTRAGKPTNKPSYISSQYSVQGDGTVVGDAIAWAVSIAQDDSHGYNQGSRNGNPDYDCSSFVSAAYRDGGGISDMPLGTTYTMQASFTARGFEVIPFSVDALQAGDVLVVNGGKYGAEHTEMYIGDGQLVGAHHGENGCISGCTPGDADGTEISVVSYYDDGWQFILRYVGD